MTKSQQDPFVLGEGRGNLLILDCQVSAPKAHICYPFSTDSRGKPRQGTLCGKNFQSGKAVTQPSNGICKNCARIALQVELPMTMAYNLWLLRELRR